MIEKNAFVRGPETLCKFRIFLKIFKHAVDPELLSKIKGAGVHPGGCFNKVFLILGLSPGGGSCAANAVFPEAGRPFPFDSKRGAAGRACARDRN